MWCACTCPWKKRSSRELEDAYSTTTISLWYSVQAALWIDMAHWLIPRFWKKGTFLSHTCRCQMYNNTTRREREKNIIDQITAKPYIGNKQIDFQQSFVQTHFDLTPKSHLKGKCTEFQTRLGVHFVCLSLSKRGHRKNGLKARVSGAP